MWNWGGTGCVKNVCRPIIVSPYLLVEVELGCDNNKSNKNSNKIMIEIAIKKQYKNWKKQQQILKFGKVFC